MRRFFLNQQALEASMVIRGDDAYHIGKVLRMKLGDALHVTAKDGTTGQAEIIRLDEAGVYLKLQHKIEECKEPPIRVILAQALPKADKLDFIIQKAVELGVYAVYPWEAEHSVVQYDAAKKQKRCERWNKIALEASKQCGRALVPQVAPVRKLDEIISAVAKNTAVILLYEGQSCCGLKQALAQVQQKDILLIIGPEGGINPKEFAYCQENGATIATMGPRILRTETAALAALTSTMYELGDLG